MQDQRTGALLRKLRQERGWTQRQVAEQLGVSTQAVSKWERDQGIPDVGLLPHLAEIFGVSMEGLLDGGLNPAAPDGGNMKRLQFYVCPDCGNILTSSSGGQLSCCGRKLEPLRAVPADAEHAVTAQEVAPDWYVTFRHPMEKGHFIRFAACVAPDRLLLVRLYPEQGSEVRLPQLRGGGKLYLCCSRHGLFEVKLP